MIKLIFSIIFLYALCFIIYNIHNSSLYNPQNEMLAFCKTKCSIRKTKRILLRIPS
nr:MAG TPA: hypothetical protein [Caudoviricetes sp.]